MASNFHVPVDEWTVKEQLYLTSAVERCGKNWNRVEVMLKMNAESFLEPNRPSDWISATNCEIQYEYLTKIHEANIRRQLAKYPNKVEKILTVILGEKRKNQLRKVMSKTKAEILEARKKYYLTKQPEKTTEAMVEEFYEEVEEEERRKEKENIAHAEWLQARAKLKEEEYKKLVAPRMTKNT